MTRLRPPSLSRPAIVALLLVAAVIGALVVWRIASTSDEPDTTIVLRGVELQTSTVYESPQNPGYTSWTGAWIMPDRSLMVAFNQATGPVDPEQRTRAPEEILIEPELAALAPERDFWGLDQTVEYLRSTDRGETWTPFRSDPFTALSPHPYTPQASGVLADGTLVRRVNGYDLRFDDSVPHTAYLQRLPPGAENWSEPQVLMDPATYTYQLTRLRRLRDGRLIALGGVWEAPAGTPQDTLEDAPNRVLLLVSSDEGRTWQEGLTAPSGDPVPGGEWDAAELPNGDLLAVFRVRDPADRDVELRRQTVLEKTDEGWELGELHDSPLPHSGHPELLATREGPVLHLATTGVDYTSDGGETWGPLRFPGRQTLQTQYYPRSLQAADGTVYVFGHIGLDDAYGERDQSIVMDRFRLRARTIER